MKTKAIITIVILGVLFGAYKSFEHNKSERQRAASNYQNLLKENTEQLDSLRLAYNTSQTKLIEYTFSKDKEFSDYFNSSNNHLNGLTKKLDAANIELKRVTGIISTLVKARDTTTSVINIDSLKHKITTLPSFSIPIFDKTPCFEISGSLNFDGVRSSIIFDSRIFTDTITRVDSWSRKKHRWVLGIKTGLFGKKLLHRNEFSKCTSKTKTIVIEKRK